MMRRSFFERLTHGPQVIAVALTIAFNRFLEWLFASKHPIVVFLREGIRHNRVLLFGSRAVIRTVRSLPTLRMRIQRLFISRALRCLEATMTARMVGGSVTAEELHQIWTRCPRRGRVLIFADGLEREQIAIMLEAARARAVMRPTAEFAAASARETENSDLIVVGPASAPGRQAAAGKIDVDKVLAVGRSEKRSDYVSFEGRYGPARATRADRTRKASHEAIAAWEGLRVVFLNDVGFQYGAGIALRRQAASFLLSGCEVHLVSWSPGEPTLAPAVVGVRGFDGWQGVSNIHSSFGKEPNDDRIVQEVLSIVRTIDPDVVITGNLHGTRFPLALIEGLKALNVLVVSYMHDCYWATGRCAYPVACNLYLTGCNENCPTADEYPRLSPSKIEAAWQAKSRIFEGAAGIPLATNSRWTQNLAVQRYGDRARMDCIHLAVDHELFAPIPKAVARRLLGLPADGLFVVMGAVDILNKWKGGDLFRQLFERIQGRGDVSILLFGQSSALLKSTTSFGLVDDERMMPLILNAADVFIGTATEEAFGQTLLEASACGLPVVAFDRGGISDIVIDGETGLLAKKLDVGELYDALDRLLADASLRNRLGENGRSRVKSRFTLAQQASAWMDYLKSLSASRC